MVWNNETYLIYAFPDVKRIYICGKSWESKIIQEGFEILGYRNTYSEAKDFQYDEYKKRGWSIVD